VLSSSSSSLLIAPSLDTTDSYNIIYCSKEEGGGGEAKRYGLPFDHPPHGVREKVIVVKQNRCRRVERKKKKDFFEKKVFFNSHFRLRPLCWQVEEQRSLDLLEHSHQHLVQLPFVPRPIHNSIYTKMDKKSET
jgi:hypothetical protein